MTDTPNPDAVQVRGVPGAVDAYEKVLAAYETGRPAYPSEAVRWLMEETALGPGTRVLDLAAGTGKLTRLLMSSGAEVLAVEPVEGFRGHLRRLGIETMDRTAEHIPLLDASVGVVTVAAAFHWFDAPRALAEIGRMLLPGGWLAILWNERDPADETQRALTNLIEPHRRTEPVHREPLSRRAERRAVARAAGRSGTWGQLHAAAHRARLSRPPRLLPATRIGCRGLSTAQIASLTPGARLSGCELSVRPPSAPVARAGTSSARRFCRGRRPCDGWVPGVLLTLW